MLLGFKDQFVPYVLDGSKTHTIRHGYGPARWKPGMRADLYEKPRQKGMRLLFRAPVIAVDQIEIWSYEAVQCGRGPIPPLMGNHCLNAHRGPEGESLLVQINGELLTASETRHLFKRDGFREPGTCPQYQALMFWVPLLPFRGHMIHWNYEARFIEKECNS